MYLWIYVNKRKLLSNTKQISDALGRPGPQNQLYQNIYIQQPAIHCLVLLQLKVNVSSGQLKGVDYVSVSTRFRDSTVHWTFTFRYNPYAVLMSGNAAKCWALSGPVWSPLAEACLGFKAGCGNFLHKLHSCTFRSAQSLVKHVPSRIHFLDTRI